VGKDVVNLSLNFKFYLVARNAMSQKITILQFVRFKKSYMSIVSMSSRQRIGTAFVPHIKLSQLTTDL
jgi:hypothetical protein